MADEADAIPLIQNAGSIFAKYGPSTPEWRKIVRIVEDPNGGVHSEVVQDYTLVKKVEAALAEMADSDDTPGEQQLLMSAWQAIAMYLSTCDDEDKPGAINALKVISNLMNDNHGDGPTAEGTFGTTMQTASADSFTCPMDSRSFGTQQGLINHLKSVHAAREKQAGYGKNPAAQDKD